MPHSPTTLQTLDAWPGETARPPLRLLAGRPAARRSAPSAPTRPSEPAGWLQRVRQALAGR